MRRVTDRLEYMDGALEHDVLAANLRDLARVNRWLGGVALTRRALIALATGKHTRPWGGHVDWHTRPLRLLDVGTGAADIPAALIDWTAGRGLLLEVEAIDERHEILDVAYERVGDHRDLHLEHTAGDTLAYPDDAFDIAHASLVMHHLDPAEVVALLRE
ncbi:MAG: methyltransferase domain-containing protein, partial [Candidatus Limnocylindrales bacterium]